jgi:type II secretory pathway component PulK
MIGPAQSAGRSRGAALILALFAVMILTALAVTFASVVRTDVLLAGNRTAMLQAFYAAQSGVNYCRTVLAADDPSADSLAAQTDWVQVEDGQTGAIEWQYPVSSPPSVELDIPGFSVNAVIEDESSRLNVNTADKAALMRLPGITEEAADAILDWRDADEQQRPLGAESDYYLSLPSPYEAADRAFDTIDELRLVRGVDEAMFEGGGMVAAPAGGDASLQSTGVAPGLRNLLTVRSGERNVDRRGNARLNLSTLTANTAQPLLQARFPSLFAASDLTAIRARLRLGPLGSLRDWMSIPGVSWLKLAQALDGVTVQRGSFVEGTVNLNTAGEAVLEAIGLPAPVAQAVINQRTGQPLTTKGQLASVAGVTQGVMIAVADHIATKSSIFGVRALGQAQDRPIRAGVLALLDRTGHPPTVLLWREDPAPSTTAATTSLPSTSLGAGGAAQSSTPLGQVSNGP